MEKWSSGETGNWSWRVQHLVVFQGLHNFTFFLWSLWMRDNTHDSFDQSPFLFSFLLWTDFWRKIAAFLTFIFSNHSFRNAGQMGVVQGKGSRVGGGGHLIFILKETRVFVPQPRTAIGFVCFVVFNPRVFLANGVDLRFFCLISFPFPPTLTLSDDATPRKPRLPTWPAATKPPNTTQHEPGAWSASQNWQPHSWRHNARGAYGLT